MKFLFDENLSPKLVHKFSDLYPGSIHVRDIGMKSVDDIEVWEYAKKNDFIIVSKDSDFHQLSFSLGFPPKVIWIRKGNCITKEIHKIILTQKFAIERFVKNPESSFLILE